MSLALQIGRIADEYVRNKFLVKICVVLWIDDTGGLVCGVDEKMEENFFEGNFWKDIYLFNRLT